LQTTFLFRAKKSQGRDETSDWRHELLEMRFQKDEIWVFPKIVGFTPKSSISIKVFHYKPSILGCFPISGNTQMSCQDVQGILAHFDITALELISHEATF